ncbi:hypothetical protein V2G26_020074 [Clonostachys chloroleuca]
MASTDDDPDGHGGDAFKSSRETSAADAPGLLTHFHLFPQLPTELRCRIWKMAICTEKTPKIHYYSLYNDDDGYRHSRLPELIDMYMKPGPKDWVFSPVAPHPLQCKPQQCDWADDNRFLSYWNAGLRTACWESRTILVRYYGPRPRRQNPFAFVNKRPYKRRKKKKSSSTTNPGKIVTIREKKEIIHLDFSKRDIVCFRFPPDEMARCVFLKWEELLTRLPFYHLPQNSDINLAFEFEHSWNEGLGITKAGVRKNLAEASARGLVLRAFWAWKVGAIPRWTRLYLIDRAEPLPPKYQIGRNYDLRMWKATRGIAMDRIVTIAIRNLCLWPRSCGRWTGIIAHRRRICAVVRISPSMVRSFSGCYDRYPEQKTRSWTPVKIVF